MLLLCGADTTQSTVYLTDTPWLKVSSHCNEFSADFKMELCHFITNCYIKGNLIENKLPGGFLGEFCPFQQIVRSGLTKIYNWSI